MKTFEDNYQQGLFLGKETLFDFDRCYSIEEFQKMKEKAEKDLKRFNPFRPEHSPEEVRLGLATKNIEFYGNFRRNLEDSDIEIYSPQKAQEIYSKLKLTQENVKNLKGDFIKKDIVYTDSANK